MLEEIVSKILQTFENIDKNYGIFENLVKPIKISLSYILNRQSIKRSHHGLIRSKI